MGMLFDAMVSLIKRLMRRPLQRRQTRDRRIAYGIVPCTCEECVHQRQGIRGIIPQTGVRIEH